MPSERTGYNNLRVEAYEAYSTTGRADPGRDLERAEGVTFDTHYPNGLFGPAEFFVPRDPAAGWSFTGNDRLVIRNGQTVAWEGALAGTGYSVAGETRAGRKVIGEGYWSWLLETRGINKPWADNRLDAAQWVYSMTATGAEKCTIDRFNRLRFTPRAASWANNEAATLDYTAPTGQTVKRVTMRAELQEQAEAWVTRLVTSDSASVLFSRTTSGSSACDVTLSSPQTQGVRFQFQAGAACTPTADGEIYGSACSVMVYTETGTISGSSIAVNLRTLLADSLNSDITRIDGPTLTLEPFVTDGYEKAARILSRAAGFGDSSFNAWAAYLDHSESAATPDGEPVLVVEQQPALTDYDYAVRLDDPNLAPRLELVRDFAGIYNWIVVRYRDELNNRDVYLTPDDNANLTDSDSVTDWGQREYVLDASLATSTAAVNLGRRYLAAHKDPRFYVAGPITVVGYIRGKNGNPVPASEIRAGRRVRIENFLSDEVDVSAAGLTFLISRTHYTDSDETCQISCGTPDDLAVLLAQMAADIT
jgi:hypothetical protein